MVMILLIQFSKLFIQFNIIHNFLLLRKVRKLLQDLIPVNIINILFLDPISQKALRLQLRKIEPLTFLIIEHSLGYLHEVQIHAEEHCKAHGVDKCPFESFRGHSRGPQF